MASKNIDVSSCLETIEYLSMFEQEEQILPFSLLQIVFEYLVQCSKCQRACYLLKNFPLVRKKVDISYPDFHLKLSKNLDFDYKVPFLVLFAAGVPKRKISASSICFCASHKIEIGFLTFTSNMVPLVCNYSSTTGHLKALTHHKMSCNLYQTLLPTFYTCSVCN